jgi:hypothetical protein
MNIEQKLSQLYAASRIAPLNADQHEAFANTLKKFCKLLSPLSIQSLNLMPTPDRNYYSYDTPEQRSDSKRIFKP